MQVLARVSSSQSINFHPPIPSIFPLNSTPRHSPRSSIVSTSRVVPKLSSVYISNFRYHRQVKEPAKVSNGDAKEWFLKYAGCTDDLTILSFCYHSTLPSYPNFLSIHLQLQMWLPYKKIDCCRIHPRSYKHVNFHSCFCGKLTLHLDSHILRV